MSGSGRFSRPTPITRRGPTVQACALPYLIAWVEQCGFDSADIRQLPGLADLSDPEHRVPEASVQKAWSRAAALTDDDAIGIHVAESLPRGAMDLVEYAFRSSASLAVGMERLARYGRVLSDRVAARMETSEGGLLVLVRDTGNTPLHHGRAEFALALALKFTRETAGDDITPLRVSFAHPAPKQTAEHRRFFRASVRFGAGANTMIFSAADAARAIESADEALSSIVRRRLEKALAERHLDDSGPMSGRVRHLIVEHLGETRLTSDRVATTLAVSPRTLSRRLAEEHTSFRELLDDVRREFASALLQDRSLSVADVAFFLQYSEPAAFIRSFRRWTGLTPRAFRDEAAVA